MAEENSQSLGSEGSTEAAPEYGVLSRATFDPKLRLYWFFQAAILMVFTIVGVVLVPFWLLGVGQVWTRRLFESMRAELTEKSLNYRKGVFFKVEKTIPLEQIQDLTIKEGPLLNALGICSLSVETAGQNTAGGGMARLTGIRGAREFRNAVLKRRDELKAESWQGGPVAGGSSAGAPATGDMQQLVTLLTEIRDLLAQRQRG